LASFLYFDNLQGSTKFSSTKVIDFETKIENTKYARRGQTKASEAIKSIQQEYIVLELKNGLKSFN